MKPLAVTLRMEVLERFKNLLAALDVWRQQYMPMQVCRHGCHAVMLRFRMGWICAERLFCSIGPCGMGTVRMAVRPDLSGDRWCQPCHSDRCPGLQCSQDANHRRCWR